MFDMSAAAQMNGTPLFTVEQIELIRRLRNSGVSKEQLVQAWDALGRLDRELGPVYTVPVTIAAAFQQQAQALQRASLNAAFSALPNVVAANAANAAVVAANVVAANNANVMQLPLNAVPQGQPPQQAPQQPQQASPQSSQASSTPEQVSRKRSIDGPAVTNGEVAPCEPGFLPNGAGPQMPLTPNDLVNLINGVTENGEDAEESQEYRDFVSKGEPSCTEEIKAFIVQNNIKQQQIATLAGISQSYVSRYLKGDYYDMSERSRRAIQKWYILYRKYPGAIVPAVNAVMLMNPSPEKKVATVNEVTSITTPNAMNGDFLKYPRRERFVFRPNHLEILEKCFQDDNYPSFEKREEIAKACNAATEAMMNMVSAGRELGDKERVTAQIISNWFANKRKELKKIAREEGLDVSQVPLRSRGRPSRLYSDLAMLQAMERSGNHAPGMMLHNLPHTEASDAAGGERGVLLSQPMTPRTPETPQGDHSGAGMEDSNSSLTMPPPSSSEASHPRSSEDAKATEGDGTLLAGNGIEPDSEESLSWSVEIAAVNQAILSLTGQQPINTNIKLDKVKSEMLEQNHNPPAEVSSAATASEPTAS